MGLRTKLMSRLVTAEAAVAEMPPLTEDAAEAIAETPVVAVRVETDVEVIHAEDVARPTAAARSVSPIACHFLAA